MVKVSTKTGDKGKTSLCDGSRVDKTHLLFQSIGDLDELNSHLGLVITKFDNSFYQQKKFLLFIQDKLFVIGAILARSKKVKLHSSFLIKLEKEADDLQKQMKSGWHKKFLLPGGTELAAHLDIARTVCRRFERSLFSLAKKEQVPDIILKSINRLSDYLYILRVFVNYKSEVVEQEFDN
jgi:cob(I)alamin adenosyltransferase